MLRSWPTKTAYVLGGLAVLWGLTMACNKDPLRDHNQVENPFIELEIPPDFPPLNASIHTNWPTRYGVELGERLFHEKRLSGNNTISCASCHQPAQAFADNEMQAIGILGRQGLRNTLPIQNLAFMQQYTWDGHKRQLESHVLVPIIAHEEMNSSILEVIDKLRKTPDYPDLFRHAFGDTSITGERIYRSIAQYQYTLISANSKYDRVKRGENEAFTESEERGYHVFQVKCADCHSTELFTDQSFRNIGFPINTHSLEAGRARVTGDLDDWMSFRVPSLRNAEFTAPYGSFGQFPTLRALLDYLDEGVLDAPNLDPILKNNENRIALSNQEKEDIIAFIYTLSDTSFIRMHTY